MIVTIRGWSFETETLRSARYRYSLSRLILEFKSRTVEIQMPQYLGEAYKKLIVHAWANEGWD